MTWKFFDGLGRLYRGAQLISISFRFTNPMHPITRLFSSQISTEPLVPSVPATKFEYLQKLLYQRPETPPDAKVLKVAVIGCPNAGKSSLVNMLVKWRVCAVAAKSHTTRSKQMAALMQDNVQVVFVDLPGLVNKGKWWRFNLDKAFMRDPHAAIFDSDLILVVVDVTHSPSKTQLDPEIVKALHFFRDKESVLVLNKIDRFRTDPSRLLTMTRFLTRGIVHKRRSHIDAYEARFKSRARLPPNSPRLKPPSELISAYLPNACHEETARLLNHLAQVRASLNPTVYPDDSSRVLVQYPTDCHLLTSEDDSAQVGGSHLGVESNRLVTKSEQDSIDDYFDSYEQAVPSPYSSTSSQDTSIPSDNKLIDFPDTSPSLLDEARSLAKDDAYFLPLLRTLEEQLMLKVASPAEVAERRKRWLDISLNVKGIGFWTGFSEVFMVSSATGNGVDQLRDYLLSKAIPNRLWHLSPLLVTEHEPSELIRMAVWARCLERLRDEIPYSIRIVVDDCEKVRTTDGDLNEGDDRVFVHARIQCRSERHLSQVLGLGGSTIKDLAASVKLDLMTMFRSNTVVKLTAELSKIDSKVMRQLRKSKDFADVFPNQSRG